MLAQYACAGARARARDVPRVLAICKDAAVARPCEVHEPAAVVASAHVHERLRRASAQAVSTLNTAVHQLPTAVGAMQYLEMVLQDCSHGLTIKPITDA